MLPSPSGSIPLPPAARNRSRWLHHPRSPVGRTSAHPETTDAYCHRCAAACQAGAVVLFAAGAVHAVCACSPARLLAALVAPTCSSTQCYVPRVVSRESVGCSDRSTSPDTAVAPLGPSPAALAGNSAFLCADRPARNSPPLPVAPASAASCDPSLQ